jgi:hypothetical protein
VLVNICELLNVSRVLVNVYEDLRPTPNLVVNVWRVVCDCMFRRLAPSIHQYMDRFVDWWIDGSMGGLMDELMDRWINRWIDGLMDWWLDGLMDG